MLFLVLFILILSQPAQSFVTLEPGVIEFEIENPEAMPSCLLVKHRRKERKKVLREMEYLEEHLKEHPKDLFLRDSVLINRLFLDPSVWGDATVKVHSTWRVTSEVFSSIEPGGLENSFLKLSGDSILWQSLVKNFPDEVQFTMDFDAMELKVTHEIYYVDYCFPNHELKLDWYSKEEEKPKTTTEVIQNLMGDE